MEGTCSNARPQRVCGSGTPSPVGMDGWMDGVSLQGVAPRDTRGGGGGCEGVPAVLPGGGWEVRVSVISVLGRAPPRSILGVQDHSPSKKKSKT